MQQRSGTETKNIEGSPNLYPQVVEGLKKLYREKIKPVELRYKFDELHSPTLRDSDFDAKPMVLLLGQYSTGKTSFIEYMLGGPFPGQRIGPEPTTDRFVAVMYGDEERTIPGNALSVDAEKPFNALNKFGTGFLSKFEAAETPSPLLKHITFIDTPGVLSGEKQRIGRSYDFISVCEWFAERADLILLLFDCNKLDISDEFKRAIEALKGQDDKIRVVLNKADQVSSQQLMRVYGALMWSLGKVVKTPEVMRVYIGSFWDQPYANEENAKLFNAERADLLRDLKSLPRNSAVRKVNELVKRARLVKVHAYLISHLKKKMPALWGKQAKQQELIAGMLNEYKEVKRLYRLPPGDFPELERFKEVLKDQDFDTFAKLDERLISRIDEVLGVDIPKLMQLISPSTGPQQGLPLPSSQGQQLQGSSGSQVAGRPSASSVSQQQQSQPQVKSQPGAVASSSGSLAGSGGDAGSTPFDDNDDDDADNPFAQDEKNVNKWDISPSEKAAYDQVFYSLQPGQEGKLTGAQVKPTLLATGLGTPTLRLIWSLSDIDKDRFLDSDEFAVALRLAEIAKAGDGNLPFNALPPTLVPPSKRHLFASA
jgi:GTPase SAR1 family protein